MMCAIKMKNGRRYELAGGVHCADLVVMGGDFIRGGVFICGGMGDPLRDLT